MYLYLIGDTWIMRSDRYVITMDWTRKFTYIWILWDIFYLEGSDLKILWACCLVVCSFVDEVITFIMKVKQESNLPIFYLSWTF